MNTVVNINRLDFLDGSFHLQDNGPQDDFFFGGGGTSSQHGEIVFSYIVNSHVWYGSSWSIWFS